MNTVCSVTNKSSGKAIYKIPEMNIRREFQPGETKPEIPVKELAQLIQQPGGYELFYHYLYVADKEIVNYLLNGEAALEYWITDKELPNWMKTCSLAEFQDALDFAPEGTKELIKKLAVSMPLTDMTKCKAIKDQLGFDVVKMIDNSGDEIAATVSTKPQERRVAAAAVTEETKPQRRVIKAEV